MTPARRTDITGILIAGDVWWSTYGRRMRVCRWLRAAGWMDDDLRSEVRIALLEAQQGGARYDAARGGLDAYVGLVGRSRLLKLGRQRTEMVTAADAEPEPVAWRSSRRGPPDDRLHPAMVRIWRWMDEQDRVVGTAEIPGHLRRLGRGNSVEGVLEDMVAAGVLERVEGGWRTSDLSRVEPGERCV